MPGAELKKYNRKLVAYRLSAAEIRRLEEASKVIGKTKTKIVEEAVGLYLNQLHISGVI